MKFNEGAKGGKTFGCAARQTEIFHRRRRLPRQSWFWQRPAGSADVFCRDSRDSLQNSIYSKGLRDSGAYCKNVINMSRGRRKYWTSIIIFRRPQLYGEIWIFPARVYLGDVLENRRRNLTFRRLRFVPWNEAGLPAVRRERQFVP